jgi:phage tail protein X
MQPDKSRIAKSMTNTSGRIGRVILLGVLALALMAAVAIRIVSHLPDERPVKGQVRLLTEKQVETATVIFERGSSMTHLAREHYGRVNPTILDLILEANPSITDINRIPIHKRIVMPSLAEDSFILSVPDLPLTIHLGTYDHRPSLAAFQNQPVLRGKTIEIMVRTISPKERWYRVAAGPFATKEEAATALKAMKQGGFSLEFDLSGK